jgi:hypothetical protein
MRSIIFALIACTFAVATAVAQERPPQGPPGTVTLSRTDYDRLLDLSNRAGVPPERAPLAAALGRADITVRVDGGVARASIALEGEVFHSGVVKVPLIAGTTLLDARLANGPLPLVSENNTLVGLISGPAAFAATLEWATPLTLTPGRGSFVLPVPSAGSVTATIDIPGERSDVRVSPGLLLSRSSAGGRTTIQATLSPGTSTQVYWSSRDSVSAPVQRDVRFLSDVKTLVTIGEAEVRAVSLIDVTVLQGEAQRFEVRLPQGYEVVSVSGSNLDASDHQNDELTLEVIDPAVRRHQFLVALEQPSSGGSFKLETTFATVRAAQRESGEVALAGVGTLEIGAADNPGLKRVDVREVDRSLATAAGQSMLAAYRYQRVSTVPPTLALDVTRFSDAPVLAAIAESAVVTTLVTTEGRALTEVTLRVRNRAQPYMKVSLPAGASIISSDVAGQPAKPADGPDGTRVPLLRPGFRPTDAYTVSFVYLHAGSPFLKKGDMRMMLPRMDLPVTLVEWEVFVPEMYRVDRFDGNVIPADLVMHEVTVMAKPIEAPQIPGTIAGRVLDQAGAPLPGANVVAQARGGTWNAVTDANGRYQFNGLPAGSTTITAQLAGFKTMRQMFINDQSGEQVDFQMAVGGLEETVTVTSQAPRDSKSAQIDRESNQSAQKSAQANEPSVNVQNLQRRASGVLPVRIEVPRAGSSYRFVKPLVIDQEASVSFRYRRR